MASELTGATVSNCQIELYRQWHGDSQDAARIQMLAREVQRARTGRDDLTSRMEETQLHASELTVKNDELKAEVERLLRLLLAVADGMSAISDAPDARGWEAWTKQMVALANDVAEAMQHVAGRDG